jgi:hypothetical protein
VNGNGNANANRRRETEATATVIEIANEPSEIGPNETEIETDRTATLDQIGIEIIVTELNETIATEPTIEACEHPSVPRTPPPTFPLRRRHRIIDRVVTTILRRLFQAAVGLRAPIWQLKIALALKNVHRPFQSRQLEPLRRR